jgi:hypothetical protein
MRHRLIVALATLGVVASGSFALAGQCDINLTPQQREFLENLHEYAENQDDYLTDITNPSGTPEFQGLPPWEALCYESAAAFLADLEDGVVYPPCSVGEIQGIAQSMGLDPENQIVIDKITAGRKGPIYVQEDPPPPPELPGGGD